VVSTETRCGFVLPSSLMGKEAKRFTEVCKKSMASTNPFITSRKYEIGMSNLQMKNMEKAAAAGKNTKTAMARLMTRKTLYFPNRGAVKPAKTDACCRATYDEHKRNKEMKEGKVLEMCKTKNEKAMRKHNHCKESLNNSLASERSSSGHLKTGNKDKNSVQKRLK